MGLCAFGGPNDAELTNEVRDRRENATEDAMPKNT